MATYRDIRRIGSGGFCEVWECARKEDNGRFAKKRLIDENDQESIQRFVREVKILSSMVHPHIVKVVGKHLQKEPYFYIMPLYKKSLYDDLENDSIIKNEERINLVFSCLLNALEYAHSHGILHRDLKPENVLMNSDTDIVVSDFGLGRFIDIKSTRLTKTNDRFGTELYVSPEQFTDAKHADERSDIFSLGRMLYEMYTGLLTPASHDLLQLPTGVAFIVEKCTQPNPDKRFRKITELKNAWKNLFSIGMYEIENDDIQLLKSKLSELPPYDNNNIARLMEIALNNRDDLEYLHEILMSINPNALKSMFDINGSQTKAIITEFLNFIQSKGWPFEYTDELCSYCKTLYNIIEDWTLKASIIRCLMIIGIDHNRFYVMDAFQSMLENIKDPAEIMALGVELSAIEKERLRQAADILDLKKVPKAIRKYFPNTSS